jgi:hypothetical protein
MPSLFAFVEGSPFGIWIVALGIIVLDSISLIEPGAFTFSFDRDGGMRFAMNRLDYQLRGKQPVLTIVKHPFSPFFRGMRGDAPDGNRLRSEMAEASAASLPVQIIAAVAFFLTAITGPAVSWFVNLGTAIMLVWALLYGLAIVGVAVLTARRAALNLDGGRLALVAVELAVCPFLAANLVKKSLARFPVATFSNDELPANEADMFEAEDA